MRIDGAHCHRSGSAHATNPHAARKAANLSINADLLSKVREKNINLSAALEQALIETLRKRRLDAWPLF